MEGKIKLDGVCFQNADVIRSFGSLSELIKSFPDVDKEQLKKAWNDCKRNANEVGVTTVKPSASRKSVNK